MIKIMTIVLLIALSGCTAKGGDVVKKDRNKIMDCTDIRDGEKFSFNSNTITNTRVGYLGAPSSADFVDLNGVKRTTTTDDNQWLKCVQRK